MTEQEVRKYTTQLKPCPFCGGKVNTTWNTKYDWQIACENESCFLHEDVILYKAFETEEAAVEAWNRRADNG